MELKKAASRKSEGRPWVWQKRASSLCSSVKADGRPPLQQQQQLQNQQPQQQEQQQHQKQQQQGTRLQHHEKHTTQFFREFARTLQAKARRPVSSLPSPGATTTPAPSGGGGAQSKQTGFCRPASNKQPASLISSKAFSPVKGEHGKRDKGLFRQLHSRFCRLFPDVLTFCDSEFGDRGFGSVDGSKVKPEQQSLKGTYAVTNACDTESGGTRSSGVSRSVRAAINVADKSSVERAAANPSKDGKGCVHDRKKGDEDSADETSEHVSVSEDQEDGETTEGTESSCEGLPQGGEKSLDASRLCPVCGGYGDDMEEGRDRKKCSHWMMMRKMEAIAMQVVLDAAMYQMTQCTQRTAELEEESCVQQILLRSALRRQAELTQEAEEKRAQVMGLMCELEASQQAWVAADEERRKLEALLAESAAKNQQLINELLQQKAEVSRLGEGMENFLRQEKTMDRLKVSLEEARMEVSALKGLLGRKPGKMESASTGIRGTLHSRSCSETMRSPVHGKEITRSRSDPEVLGGSDKKRSAVRWSSKSEDMSESIISDGESSLWQSTRATPRRESSSNKPRADEGSRDCYEIGSQGAVDIDVALSTNLILRDGSNIESTDLEDVRMENERLKKENNRLIQECDKTRRLLEVSQLRTKGNVAFNRMEYDDAYENYTSALQLEVDDKQLNALLYCNRAAASSALGNHMDALADCVAAINLDEQCTRAYSRRADVYIAIWDYEAALNDLMVVLERGGECLQEVEEKITAVRRRLRKHSGELDYYAVLALTSSCSPAEIKASYRKLALKYHPDKGGANMEASFKFISRAYKVLSDPMQRYKYDSSVGRDKHLHRVRTVIP